MATFKLSDLKQANTTKPPTKSSSSGFHISDLKKAVPTPAPVVTPAPPPTAGDKFNTAIAPEVNLAKGVAKGALSTAQGLGQLVLKRTDAVGLTKGAGETTFADTKLPGGGTANNPDFLKAKGVTQMIGKGAEQVGEFFASPEADIAKAGEYAAKVAGNLPKIAKTVIGVGARALARGAATAPISAGQTGTVSGGIEGGATGAASEPLANILTGTVKSVLPSFADWVQKTSLRLTPVQIRDLGPKIDAVSKYLTENNIVGTARGRYAKISAIHNGMEDTIQGVLNGAAKDLTVAKADVMASLEGLKSKYANDRDVIGIENQIDDAKAALNRQPSQIPLANLNTFKRSTFSNAYSKSGAKVLDTVEHEIGDTVYGHLSSALDKAKVTIEGKTLKEFNNVYSTVINAKKLLKAAASRKQAGFTAKLIASLAGTAAGSFFGPIGEAMGAVLAPAATEALAGAPVRSALASGASKLGKVLPKVSPEVIQSGQGLQNNR